MCDIPANPGGDPAYCKCQAERHASAIAVTTELKDMIRDQLEGGVSDAKLKLIYHLLRYGNIEVY